jgi:hypothetical protein
MREGSLIQGKTIVSFLLAAVIAALLVFVASPDAYKQGWGYGGGGGGGGDGAPAKYDVVVVVNPVDGGNVTLNPAGGNYYSGTSVTLTAVPEDGYEFSEWSGSLTGTENPVIIRVYSGKSIAANFVSTTDTPVSEQVTEDITGKVDADGVITETVIVTSSDGDAVVEVPMGTTALDADGNALGQITCQPATPAPVSAGANVIVVADFGPDGATFDPPIVITMSYDPSDLPDGVAEEDLVLAYYDAESGEWVELANIVVDTENHTVSGIVSHFTQFAVLGQAEEDEPVIVPTSEPTLPSEPAVIEPTSEPTTPSEPVIEPTSIPESVPTVNESQPLAGQPDKGGDDNVNPWSIIVPIIVILVLGIGGYIFIQRRRVET